jgi:hypothetical protein
MDPIADLLALRTLLVSLKAKGLVVPLTPEGRGHAVTHGLYPPRELERLKAEFARGPAAVFAGEEAEAAMPAGSPASVARPAPAAASPGLEEGQSLRRELGELRSQLANLQGEVQDLSLAQQRINEELRHLKDALGEPL